MNTSATFTSNAGGGNGGPYTYAWSNGGTGASTTNTITSNTTLTLTLNDGCSPPVQTAVTVIANPLPVVAFTPAQSEGCAPLTVDFADSSVSDSGSTYQWNMGDGTIMTDSAFTYTYATAGTYNVSLTVTTSHNCKASAAAHPINVFPVPDANYATSEDVVAIYHPYVNFTDLSTEAISWSWDFGDSTTSTEMNPMHMYTDTGTYNVTLIVESAHGCRDTIYGVIVVKGEYTMFIPNTFTPNGDGINDFFRAFGTGMTEFEMVILDRWGARLYESNSINKPWDGSYWQNGKMCQNDVYVYKITARDIYDKVHKYVGHVTLWR
jgi:gliding motility-associated-like protein